MKKIIKIVPYNPNWPKYFENIAKDLKNILGNNCIAVHHVGSTSVAELCAKPVIDVFCVVEDLKSTITDLEKQGYQYKGEYNLPLRLFFNKKTPYDINLHVATKNSGELKWQLTFRDYLINNPTARELYSNVKLDLVKNNPDGFDISKNSLPEYTILKGEIITKIAKMAKFNEYRFIIPSNLEEIKSCINLLELPKNTDLNHDNEIYFCLYKGLICVGATFLIIDTQNKTAKIKLFKSTNDTAKSNFEKLIRDWCEFHDLTIIKSADLFG